MRFMTLEQFLIDHFASWAIIPEAVKPWVSLTVAGVALLAAAWLANAIAKRILLRGLKGVAGRTSAAWDDRLITHHVFDRLSHIAPAVVFYLATPLFLEADWLEPLVERVAFVAMILISARVVDALLNFTVDTAKSHPALADKPVKSWVQVLKIFLWAFVAIFAISTLMDKSPWALLGGLGALTAVLLMVFKDSILGLVASIQISALGLVQVGDWIEVPKYGADGDVIDISLTTVRIQNWDKTISTIPTYALVSDSFKNWRGMQESGGRRMKRALRIDMNSVRFLTPEDTENLRKVQHLAPYLDKKEKELSQWNAEKGVDKNLDVNGRRLTNLGTFREYLRCWLTAHPEISQDMTFLVRQLTPDEHGLPVEIYIFSTEQRWAHYEGILGDIFDHMIAALPTFGLLVYQKPTGADFSGLRPPNA